MGRFLRYTERVLALFEAGTFDRIARVLDRYEARADFIRAAVEAELQRREAAKEKAER